jgi:hypothetical protein
MFKSASLNLVALRSGIQAALKEEKDGGRTSGGKAERGSTAIISTRKFNIRSHCCGRLRVKDATMTTSNRSGPTTVDNSKIPVGLIALGFGGFLCAMVVGFISVSGPPASNSADYGYMTTR